MRPKYDDLEGTGKSVYNPRWRDTNKDAYEQTIVFGVDEIRINGHYQHQNIFTAIHEELAVAMGIIKAKGDTTPGPSTLVAYQGNDYKKPGTWARFFRLTGRGKFFGDASVRQLGDTRVERWMVRKRVCQPHQDLARVQ